jgi:uncharacterized protein involved in response to NO
VERARHPRIAAYRAFYPAAALYGALALPASILAMTGALGGPIAVASPAGHAQEMLFGFALAVVAGNQLGLLGTRRLAALVALWAAARAAFLLAPASVAAGILNAAFAAVLGLHLVPHLFGAAKKWRNRALPFVLAALCLLAAASPHALYPAVALFALLMLFMGGRLLAPAIAGALRQEDEPLAARVQPRLEGASIIACLAAAGGLLGADSPLLPAAALATAGVLTAVRMARWRLWALRGRPDLLCLAIGYAWLALGLAALGAALAAGRYESAALHVITVGALGTLTFNVMARTWLLKARRPPERAAALLWGTAMLGGAALLRVLAGVLAGFLGEPWMLGAAAACWSAAYLLLLWLFRPANKA